MSNLGSQSNTYIIWLKCDATKERAKISKLGGANLEDSDHVFVSIKVNLLNSDSENTSLKAIMSLF